MSVPDYTCLQEVFICIIPFRGSKMQDFIVPERSHLNTGKLRESFRNFVDWEVCQLKGRLFCHVVSFVWVVVVVVVVFCLFFLFSS